MSAMIPITLFALNDDLVMFDSIFLSNGGLTRIVPNHSAFRKAESIGRLGNQKRF
jgi:hypothetical protein